jgi:hypothetical protein
MFYVQVIAPMDQVYVGPFETETAAREHAVTIVHDTCVMTEAEMLASQQVYGEIPVQRP